MLNQTAFEQWLELQEAAKKELPAIGSVLACEDSEKVPHLEWVEEKQMLTFSCGMSTKIINDDGSVAHPYWVLVPEGGDVRGTLRAIVSKKFRDMYLKNKDNLNLKQARIVAHANNKRSVIVEFIL